MNDTALLSTLRYDWECPVRPVRGGPILGAHPAIVLADNRMSVGLLFKDGSFQLPTVNHDPFTAWACGILLTEVCGIIALTGFSPDDTSTLDALITALKNDECRGILCGRLNCSFNELCSLIDRMTKLRPPLLMVEYMLCWVQSCDGDYAKSFAASVREAINNGEFAEQAGLPEDQEKVAWLADELLRSTSRS